MIKIAFVIDTIDSPTAGTEKQLLLLLEKLDRSTFSPVLCVLYTSEWLEKYFDHCPLHILNMTSFRHPLTLYRYWRFVHFLKAEKIDIVYSLFKEGMRVGISAAKLAGIRHTIAARRSQGYWMTSLDLKVTKLLNRWVNLIISNALNTRVWVAEREGFPIKNIEVVHNGIDLDPFIHIPDDTCWRYRAILAIPEEAPVIGIVANLRPVKAIDMFIRSAQLIKKAIPNAHFVIVGEGELKEDLKKLAGDLELTDFVHFLGRRHDIPFILTTFDVGVLTSKSESFSNTIVEYLAAGLPVVCTDVGGAREAVEDGVNGFVVPADDCSAMTEKIVDILKNCKAKALGEASRRKAEESFSLTTMMTKYENIFSTINVRV